MKSTIFCITFCLTFLLLSLFFNRHWRIIYFTTQRSSITGIDFTRTSQPLHYSITMKVALAVRYLRATAASRIVSWYNLTQAHLQWNDSRQDVSKVYTVLWQEQLDCQRYGKIRRSNRDLTATIPTSIAGVPFFFFQPSKYTGCKLQGRRHWPKPMKKNGKGRNRIDLMRIIPSIENSPSDVGKW